VTDHLTGLIWLEDAGCFGQHTWGDALTKADALFDGCSDCGGVNNDCGLQDGSIAGQWRLPNVRALQSLIHYGWTIPALPDTVGTGQWSEGDPFSGVQSLEFYWSSTTNVANINYAWLVDVTNGALGSEFKELTTNYFWPVRGGQ
jgi:hypothetical protein